MLCTRRRVLNAADILCTRLRVHVQNDVYKIGTYSLEGIGKVRGTIIKKSRCAVADYNLKRYDFSMFLHYPKPMGTCRSSGVQIVPDSRSGNRKVSVAETVLCSWDNACSVVG